MLALVVACGPKNQLPPGTSLSEAQLKHIVQKQSLMQNVPVALVLAIIDVESGGNPNVVGRSGSIGLMQIKPATAKQYGITDLFDPASNVDAGVHYLHDLIKHYHGNLQLAVAGYNAGPHSVDAAKGIPPATQPYVDKVFAAYARYKS